MVLIVSLSTMPPVSTPALGCHNRTLVTSIIRNHAPSIVWLPLLREIRKKLPRGVLHRAMAFRFCAIPFASPQFGDKTPRVALPTCGRPERPGRLVAQRPGSRGSRGHRARGESSGLRREVLARGWRLGPARLMLGDRVQDASEGAKPRWQNALRTIGAAPETPRRSGIGGPCAASFNALALTTSSSRHLRPRGCCRRASARACSDRRGLQRGWRGAWERRATGREDGQWSKPQSLRNSRRFCISSADTWPTSLESRRICSPME